MKLSNCNIKKRLTFSQKEAFLILQETEISKNTLYFNKRTLFLYLGKRKPLKTCCISGNGTFLPQVLKISYISGGTSTVPKTKIYYTTLKKVINFSKITFR